MYSTLTTLIDRLDGAALDDTDVIRWSSPVPSFGDLDLARVATLGINPSNREFVDDAGNELEGVDRRFHTLSSLGLSTWADANARHLELVLRSCTSYFSGNPYDRWFRRLDTVLEHTGASFYDDRNPACHLDLIPYATGQKWTALTIAQRSRLLSVAGDTLAMLLRESEVRLLVLNGQSVVENFQQICGHELDRNEVAEWALPRQGGNVVRGIAYKGIVRSIAGFDLMRPLLVLGYNHNLQSSFGVTTTVVHAIRGWIGKMNAEVPW